MQVLRVPLQQPYHQLTVDFLNKVFGCTPTATDFRRTVLVPRICSNFERALPFTLSEAIHSFEEFWNTCNLAWIFYRLSKMMCLRFSRDVFDDLREPNFLRVRFCECG
jgi:hypothetical protein